MSDMLKKKKVFLVLSVAAILVAGLSTAAFAAVDFKTPAEIVAELTGKSEDEVIEDRQAGNSYGAQALEAGKLEEFKAERLELRKQVLDQAVLDGRLTQEEADKLIEEMTLRMEDCDGTQIGLGQGTGSGVCSGQGDGTGVGRGSGMGIGGGMGMMGRGSGNGGQGQGACVGCTADTDD